MQATFVELPPFERTRKDYMDDEAYSALQQELMANPMKGKHHDQETRYFCRTDRRL